jgi:5-oxoprolinase (ATP-hydrolysing) subunit C
MSLVVTRALGLCTVQDLGRRGHMHEAVPPGGALVSELLVLANRRAGNPDDAPAIEVLGSLTVRACVDLVVATERDARELVAGETTTVTSDALRCAYLAVHGGVAAPRILDGCGTLLCAGLGAALRKDDALAIGSAAASDVIGPVGAAVARSSASADLLAAIARDEAIRVVPGPDLDAFGDEALARLTAAPYRILPTSDRVGTRLAGAALPPLSSAREVSRPMVRGALEVPRDGQPIVLGPEHPTTGGYPIVAVIASGELGRFHAIRLGASVRFAVAR